MHLMADRPVPTRQALADVGWRLAVKTSGAGLK